MLYISLLFQNISNNTNLSKPNNTKKPQNQNPSPLLTPIKELKNRTNNLLENPKKQKYIQNAID